MRRQRRLGADLAALALDDFEQRGLLAADIGAGADADLQVNGAIRSAPRGAIASRIAAIASGYSERM